MNYYELKSKLNGHKSESYAYSYGHLIEQTEDSVLIDGAESDFNTLEEARQYIKQQYITEKLEKEITKELYEELDNTKIASIIKEHHDIKVTDTIIESYLQLASSKAFTLDPVVEELRTINKLDKLIEGKLDFVLNDGSVIAIDESTYNQINNILSEHNDIIEYMRESKQNFINVVEQLEG